MRNLREEIVALLTRQDYLPLDAHALARSLRIEPDHRQEWTRALRELERDGRIVRIKGDRFVRPREVDLIPGRIRINRQGKGFLQPDDADQNEVVIPESATGTALHEDHVLVRLDVRPKGLQPRVPQTTTGTVVRILERRRTRIVGTLRKGRQVHFVVPDDPRIPHDIVVPAPRDAAPPRINDKVVVALREWQSRHTSPEGEIVETLGPPDAEGVDILGVLRQYDLPVRFPAPVLAEARRAGTTVQPAELQGRVDCRSHRVITIDPDDAKDFDDAICLERSGNTGWRLWVHIADVSHYVRPGSALDTEARRRGNSTYLVDRVVPMLPEALSNELCSLKPGVDRLTKCVEFLLSDDGRVLDSRFYASAIRSQRRLTYQEASDLLQRKPSDPVSAMLHQAHALAQRIRRARFKAGSLELDFPEWKIRLDERGRIARIERVAHDASHQLIEEFMLLANEAVATRLLHLRRPALHRIHEEPDARRLQEYREELLRHNVPCGNLSRREEVQRLLHRLDRLPIGSALKIGFLRSLSRARYAVEATGHYGLAKRHYTHFTSPIRRYADLVVHRALFERAPAAVPELLRTAGHLSLTERNSADAERDSKEVKVFAFLAAQLRSGHPRPYEARVTEVRNFGFFVDVPGLAMGGLVPLSAIKEDLFAFDAERNHLVGRRTRRVIRLGEAVTVQVAKVDVPRRQVDFRLAPAGLVVPPRPRRDPPSRESRTADRGHGHRPRRRDSQTASPHRPGTAR